MQLQKRISGFLANRGKVETVMALPVHYIPFLKTVIHTLREVTFRLPTLFQAYLYFMFLSVKNRVVM